MSANIANWLQVNIVNNPQVLKSLIALGILIGAGFLMFGKPTKKTLSKRLSKRLAGVALFVFGVFVFLHANIADLADVFIVLATIVLAGVAVFSFEESRRLRKDSIDREGRDRKERLLNEIIGWALDTAEIALRRRTMQETTDFLTTKMEYRLSQAKSGYISKIVSLSFDDLSPFLEKAIAKLNEAIDVITQYIAKDPKKSHPSLKDLRNSEKDLTESVEKLIVEAAKIKTKDIT